jgi:hypothetical protein
MRRQEEKLGEVAEIPAKSVEKIRLDLGELTLMVFCSGQCRKILQPLRAACRDDKACELTLHGGNMFGTSSWCNSMHLGA